MLNSLVLGIRGGSDYRDSGGGGGKALAGEVLQPLTKRRRTIRKIIPNSPDP
jgi:hypothetical protein